MSVKLAILFYSTYGTNRAMAEIAAEAARAAGAEVKLLRIAETAPAESAVNSQDGWKAEVAAAADDPGRDARRHGMGRRLSSSRPPPALAARPARSAPSSTRWAASGSPASWPTRRSAP
jgi:hypothetical protein